jgi:hypothetical protein
MQLIKVTKVNTGDPVCNVFDARTFDSAGSGRTPRQIVSLSTVRGAKSQN